MSANNFSPESKIELELLQFLYNGINEIKYINIPDDAEITTKQRNKLRKYIDDNYNFYLYLINYTQELYREERLSKLNGRLPTIYIIIERTDPLFVRYFSKKHTEFRGPYLFIGKKTNYSFRSPHDKYSVSHPYLFIDKEGTLTDGKQEFYEVFNNGVELDIISSSRSPSPPPAQPPSTQLYRKSKKTSQKIKKSKKTKTLSPPVIIENPIVHDIVVLDKSTKHDVGTSPITSQEKNEVTLPPSQIDVVHAVPIIPSIKPIKIKIISEKNREQLRKQTPKKSILPKRKITQKKHTQIEERIPSYKIAIAA